MVGDAEKAYWGAALQPWPAHLAETLRVPASSRAYLHEVGLPARPDWTLELNAPLTRIERMESRMDLVVLGIDGGYAPLCLDESRNGIVICVEPEGGVTRYVNSTVVDLGQFLLMYAQYREAVRAASDAEQCDLVRDMVHEMRECDPLALGDSENYWAVIVEQTQDGLL